MTLNEYIKQNGSKQIEIQDDGTIKVLEDKGSWKPETGEQYYIISDVGNVKDSHWDDDRIDNFRLDMGDVFRTEAEAERALHRLKARKKFLDAGGHEGPEAHKAFRERPDGPMWCTYPCISGKLEAYEADYLSAFEIWFESEDDARKAIDSLSDDEKAALCWTGDGE